MSDILRQIVETKHIEVANAQARHPLREVIVQVEAQGMPRDFLAALQGKHKQSLPAVIAEIKKASPSKGLLREDYRPDEIALDYEKNGAACLSVLTDKQYFQGRPQDLVLARAACQLPVLRKDFIIDDYQIYESRAMGADCILLIAAIMDVTTLKRFEDLAHSLQMAVLVEVHDEAELALALSLNTPLIGINNRDLRSFVTNIATTFRLLEKIPAGKIVVTESGISSPIEVIKLRAAGVATFLVGEAFMRAPSPGRALSALFATR